MSCIDNTIGNSTSATITQPCAPIESPTQVVNDTQSAIANEVVSVKRAKTGTKKPKPTEKLVRPSMSPMWNHFNKHFVDGSEKFAGVADCMYCGKLIKCPSINGTTILKNHLKRCPRYAHSSKKDKNQQEISFSGSQATNWVFDQERCRKLLARMIILCELPFSFVEQVGFRWFCQDLCPKFRVLSRTTVVKDCMSIYCEEKRKLKEYFMLSSTRVCLTTDLWTSIQNLGYLCLTAHYVDNDWKLQKRIINFCVLPAPHKGENIAQALETCILDWGLTKLCTLTVDNASSNDTGSAEMVKMFNKRSALLLKGEFFHVRCFAHILNLVVRDGVREIKSELVRLRESVKYVRSSPSRMQMFKKYASEEKITSKKGLCLDVTTRWNSTYLMIGAALKFEKAFDRMARQDLNYRHEMVVTLKIGVLEDVDWNVLRSLHTFLKEFYHLTNRISGSNYLTSNKYFDELTTIKDLLMDYLVSDDAFLCDMAKKMNLKFDKYCEMSKINPILIVAIVLDPRFKLQFVEYWYAEFYRKDGTYSDVEATKIVEEFIERIRDLMSRLYCQYKVEVTYFDDVGSTSIGDAENLTNSSDMAFKSKKKTAGFHTYLKRKQQVEAMNDLVRYLEDGVEEKNVENMDVLDWWRGKISTYHALAMMARDILAIPLTSVASECAFSTAGRVLNQFRSSLTPKVVESLICAQDWIKGSSKSIDIEEKIESLENLEKELEDLSLGSTKD